MSQERHEKLIAFLSEFKQYQNEDGTPKLKKVKKTLTSKQIENINFNEINAAVVVLTDVLNIGGGSIGNIDLYRLLQAYLLVPEYREKIDIVVNEAHRFEHNKMKAKKQRKTILNYVLTNLLTCFQ